MYRFSYSEIDSKTRIDFTKKCLKTLEKLTVHSTGFEPVTFGSVDRCSIQLSYECELVTFYLQIVDSTSGFLRSVQIVPLDRSF